MQTHNKHLMFLAAFAVPSVALTEVGDVVTTASTGPWLPLVLIVVVRTLVGWTAGDLG